MKHIHYYILASVSIILMASCSSSRKVSQTSAATQQISLDDRWNTGDCVTAHSSVKLESNKNSISLGGNLRMKRDDVVQLNLTYILGIQVGTLQLTQDSVLLLSRITHQYAVATYSELSTYLGHQVTFSDIQKFFWGEADPISTSQLTFKYNGFEAIDTNRQLPKEVIAQLSLSKTKAGLDVQLSNFNRSSDWQTRTDFTPSRYSKVTLAEVIKMLMSAAQ